MSFIKDVSVFLKDHNLTLVNTNKPTIFSNIKTPINAINDTFIRLNVKKQISYSFYSTVQPYFLTDKPNRLTAFTTGNVTQTAVSYLVLMSLHMTYVYI